MSVQKFQYLLHRAEYGKNDKKYFPYLHVMNKPGLAVKSPVDTIV